MLINVPTLPKITEVVGSSIREDSAQLALRAENGSAFGMEISRKALVPMIVSLLEAGRMLPEQGPVFDVQAIRAQRFQFVTLPDGTKGITIWLGGALELVLIIPQEAMGRLRAAITELEAIPGLQ